MCRADPPETCSGKTCHRTLDSQLGAEGSPRNLGSVSVYSHSLNTYDEFIEAKWGPGLDVVIQVSPVALHRFIT